MEKILVFLVISILFVNDAVSQRLQKYNVDPYSITVSGFSSGASMATQFHFAHSSKIAGVGIISGVPNLCAEGGKDVVDFCIFNPTAVNVSYLIERVNVLATDNLIDAVANVTGDKVFIYHGSKDEAILPASGRNVQTMYANYGADIETEFTIPVGHGFPTRKNIGYNGAFNMLNHLYGGGLTLPADDAGNSENLLTFDQREFFAYDPIYSSMSASGFIYVPTACQNGVKCRLHIMFHGCLQSSGNIGNAFASRVDIMGVAEVNNIIVLLPQIAAFMFINPWACWDWFAYTNNMYATRHGKQIYGVYRMGTRVVAG